MHKSKELAPSAKLLVFIVHNFYKDSILMPYERGQSAVLFSNLAVGLDESGNEADRVSNQPPCTVLWAEMYGNV
jgi:hypothetical protein